MPKGIPLTDEEQLRKRHEIFFAAAGLFLDRGFNETSMREIAAAAGMGKSSLYDYFKTKDEILCWYFEDNIEGFNAVARDIAQQNMDPVEKLRRILHMQLERLLENRDFYIRLSIEVQRLGADSQIQIQKKRHAYQDLIREIIEDGVRQGVFRPVNSLLASRLLITFLTPVAFTTRPTGTPEEMLDDALGLFLKGVQA
jgi:TetR/AcrR family transcriptional regulator, cholesterol catabolism regulator